MVASFAPLAKPCQPGLNLCAWLSFTTLAGLLSTRRSNARPCAPFLFSAPRSRNGLADLTRCCAPPGMPKDSKLVLTRPSAGRYGRSQETTGPVRPSGTQIIAIFVASLAIWSTYYSLYGEPLSQAETAVVVGACALAVLLVSRALTRVRKWRNASADGA